MVTQFNDVLMQRVLAAGADDAGSESIEPGKPGFLAEKTLDWLNGLKVGKRLSSSPLIKVIAKDEEEGTITFLIRGRMKINKGRFSPFVRIEIRLLTTQLGVDAVTTFIAELKFVESEATPVTEVRMGLGYDGLVFSGRGMARVTPIGFGLDIFLGGVSDRGIMLGIDVFLPVPVLLGSSGLGLSGIGGDYAHNFKPRLESGLEAEGTKLNLETGDTPPEEPVEAVRNPTAIHYIQWARNPDEALDRWVEAPPDETAIGIGVRAYVSDVPSSGNVLQIGSAGFAVFTPGAVIILGGEGKLLNSDSIGFEAFAVIDAASGSFALGGGVEVKIPSSGALIELIGKFDSFFSRSDPGSWFITLGTERDPNRAKFLVLFSAKTYFEINHYRVAFGVELTWREGIKLASILEVFILGGGGLRALIGWNPRQLAGALKLFAEAGFRILKIKLSAKLNVEVWGHVPKPRILEATTTVTLNLPWPIPDARIKIKLPREKEDIAPEIKLPFREGENIRTGALHALSGRQWDLVEPSANAVDQPWPDVHIVVHFSRRVTDETGKVLGAAVAAENNGGYDVFHRLTMLELTDVVNGVPVEGIQAAWAESPDGETAQLHVLAQDPYSWLFWNESVSSAIGAPVPATALQLFGLGEEAVFETPRRFGKVEIAPAGPAALGNAYSFALPRRTIACAEMTLLLRAPGGQPVFADEFRFYVLEHRTVPTSEAFVSLPDMSFPAVPASFTEIFPDLYLVGYEVTIPPGTAIDRVRLVGQVAAAGTVQAIVLYGVLFREVPVPSQTCQERVILTPGRYRLDLAGATSAVSVDGNAEPEPLDWSLVQEFEVIFPYSLRPYLRDTTVGDSRLFRDAAFAWDPTLYGIGFPAYRGYLPAIRFIVPYLSAMFPTLRFRLAYEEEGGPVYSFTAEPVPAAGGDNSLLEPAQDFLDWVGCPVGIDEELLATEPLPQAGGAEVRLIFDAPGGQSTVLDSWNCVVSRFLGFAEQMTLGQTTLRRIYDADGPHALPPCFTPGNLGFANRRSIGGGRLDPPAFAATPVLPPPGPGPLLPADFLIGANPPFPDELDEPPLNWRLPSTLAAHLEDDSVPLPVAFARFAADSGAVFSDLPGNPMFGLANPVEETAVEGIADGAGRLFAIWLRTPEPVDWRRCAASLRIRHLVDDDGCSRDYAYRRPMDLAVEMLPGPDASSAFLVGSLGNIRTRLPRGEYELVLSFDPAAADLPRLRPGPAVTGPKETVMLKFLQMNGLAWPLPNAAVAVPGHMLARLMAAAERSEPGITALASSAIEEGSTARLPASSGSAEPASGARPSASPAPLSRLAGRRAGAAVRPLSRRRPRVEPTGRIAGIPAVRPE